MPLTDNQSPPEDKARRIFAKTAGQYDLLNTLMSFGLDILWRRSLVSACNLEGDEKILDIGTGTGALVFDILKKYPDVEIIGLDPVPQMLQVAQVRAHQISTKARVSFKEGVAEELPFPNQSFDRIVTAFTLRNFSDRQRSFREVARTLKKGGKFISLELTRPKNGVLRQLHRVYVKAMIPVYGRMFRNPEAYRYLAETVLTFPEPEAIREELSQVGFGRVEIRTQTFGVTTLHIAK